MTDTAEKTENHAIKFAAQMQEARDAISGRTTNTAKNSEPLKKKSGLHTIEDHAIDFAAQMQKSRDAIAGRTRENEGR